MKNPLRYATEWALMVTISAFLFVEFFKFNNWVFSVFEHAQGINWIFLPAGFRVLLVLVLGLPGGLGIMAGTLWLDQSQLLDGQWSSTMVTAIASGMAPWLIKCWMESRGWLHKELKNINAQRLLNFVLVYAVVNAVSHQAIRWHFQHAGSQPWLDVWPMFVGDALGAMAILYAMKLSLPWLRQYSRTRA